MEKQAGRWSLRLDTGASPLRVELTDLASNSNPYKQTSVRFTLEEARDLAFCLERVLANAPHKL